MLVRRLEDVMRQKAKTKQEYSKDMPWLGCGGCLKGKRKVWRVERNNRRLKTNMKEWKSSAQLRQLLSVTVTCRSPVEKSRMLFMHSNLPEHLGPLNASHKATRVVWTRVRRS